jgi:hypothetical protein
LAGTAITAQLAQALATVEAAYFETFATRGNRHQEDLTMAFEEAHRGPLPGEEGPNRVAARHLHHSIFTLRRQLTEWQRSATDEVLTSSGAPKDA